MVQKRHGSLILVALIIFTLFFSGSRIPQAFAAIQKSFVLNPDSASFSFEESRFNDSNSCEEYNFPSAGNATYWVRIPKNSAMLNATINLTGKIIYVYSIQASTSSIKGLSTGSAQGSENQISFATTETDGKAKLLYGANGSNIWSATVSSGWDTYSTSIGNMTNDQGSEIAVGSQDGNVYLLSSNGTEIWHKSTGGQVQSVKIGDVYGNGINFTVAGSGSSVQVLNSSGGLNWSAAVGCAVYDIAIGNFSSDTGNEIIAGCDSGKILVLNSSGTQAANMTIGSGSDNINSVDIGNVTSDAGNEIVAGSNDNRIYVINASGNVAWNYSTGGSVFSVRIGDVTTQYPGNEVVAGSNDKKIYTLDKSGNMIWSFEAGSYIKTIAIGNLTADAGTESINEVAAGAGNGYLYVFNFDYFPDNTSIDVNGSAYDWSYPGKLRNTTIAGGTYVFINAVQTYLDGCTAGADGTCSVPLLFHSDWAGRLNISGLNFTYSYNISGLVNATTIGAWSRIWNIHMNESVGSQVRNISFLRPSNDILVTHVRINQTAIACDFNGSSYTIATAEGQVACDVPDFYINTTGTLPGPLYLWDSNMSTGAPVRMNESAAYYTSATDSFLWRKNLTIWNTSSTTIYNATANTSINDTAVHGLEFLNVSWQGSWCDITPAASTSTCNTTSPAYTAKTCSGQVFFACKQDTNGNGIYDYFGWVQPYANSSTDYVIGGSIDLASSLSSQNVTPSAAIWGSNFSYSVYVSDTENDTVNVKLWVRRNLSSSWETKSDQNITAPGNFTYNATTDNSWVGQAQYAFQYQDFNASGYPIHSSLNTSAFSGPAVTKHNASPIHAQGNNSDVNRNSSVLLSIRVNDTETGSWTGGNVNCTFWITTNGVSFDSGHYNSSNASGYCNYLFTADGNYSSGNQTWKAGIVNDTYYLESNSSNFTVAVKGRINITLVLPALNQTFYRNSSNAFLARMADEYGAGVSYNDSAGKYNCTFWLVNQSGENQIGNSSANASGWCSFSWSPNCTVSLGNFTVNVTLSGNASEFYSIEDSENSTQILMKDVLLTRITVPAAYSSYHKGDSINLNSSANDTCSMCGQPDYITAWSIKWKHTLQIDLNETRGFSRTNETIIINGSELEGLGIDLSDWRIAHAKVLSGGQEVPSEVKAWTNGSKTEINASQTFFNNYSELVFIASVSSLQGSAYRVYYNETNPIDWNISYILNGGFEGAQLSPWQCINNSDCSFELCDCTILNEGNETAGNYSLRLLVNPSSNNPAVSASQNLSAQISSAYIKIRYKSAGIPGPSIRISAGGGTCNLSNSDTWTEALCQNASFQAASSLNITLSDGSADGIAGSAYIDYICIADSSGNCISLHSGYPPARSIESQSLLGSGNMSWAVQVNETLGLRRILANSTGPNHLQNFSTVPVLLFGWSNVSWMNLTSAYCMHNQTFECMSNATMDFFCSVLDVNTSLGIYNYNVSFFRNSTLIGYNMTNSSGFVMFRWVNSTTEGTYNISCNISNSIYEPNSYYNITSNNSRDILVKIVSGNTTANISISPLAETAINITKEQNHTFYLNVTINNTGNGTMYNPAVNISSPAGVFVQQMTCPIMAENSSCFSSLQANVTQSTSSQNLAINTTVLWSNADATYGNSSNQTILSVQNHTVLNITQTQVNMTIARGDSRAAGNLTIEAYGNTPLSNITFSLSGANSSAVSGWINYTPSSISDIAKAASNLTIINLTIPSNATEGVYTATLLANATGSSCVHAADCTDSLSLLVNVTPPDWDSSPSSLSWTIPLNGGNGTIGVITITNNKNQNYSLSVSVTSNTSGYIKTDKSSLNLTALSSAYIYVYHNASGEYDPGYWSANITMSNLDSSAFPHVINATVNLSVINLTVKIISPNQTIPTSPINASSRINITVSANLSGVPVSENMTWTVLIGGQACGGPQSSYNSTTHFWGINCTAPSIADNVIYNDLKVTGNYTNMTGAIVSDVEANAVRYQDITPPHIANITVNPVNYYSSTPYIIINSTITDNTGVAYAWALITQPGGANATLESTNASSLYAFNFSNPNLTGDYDVYVFSNDSYGQMNVTRGWFDVYRPFTVYGSLTDPNSGNQSVNFTFYRPGSSTVIHAFSTNASQSSYNWSIHDRNYDVQLSAFGHTITLYGVNITATARNQHNVSATNASSVFRFDNFPNRTSSEITNFNLPNTAQKIILGFVIETPNLSYSNATITIDYAEALAAALGTITIQESNLRVFRCANWSFQSRVCSSGEFSHFNESLVPDTSANTFTFTSAPSTAYAVAESCYPNICGQTPQQPPGSSGTTQTPGGGGGTTQPVCGNGKCETGENSQNCPKDCPAETDPFTVKTGITNIRLRPGDKATYPLSITNKLNRTMTADISVAGLESYFTLEKKTVEIDPGKTESFNIYVSVPETTESGTYTGTITVSAEGRSKDLPVAMVISLEGKSQLSLILNLLTKRIEPGGKLKYTVEIRNVGFGENITSELGYTVRNAETEEIIKSENETVKLSLATGESSILNKVMQLSEEDAPVGQYYLEAVAVFDHRFVRDIETFEVAQVFWNSLLGQYITWLAIVGAIIVIAFYERKRYARWKMKKVRYLFPVNYSKIPQENEDAFWIGRIAETDKKAWFNPNDLTTHVLIAGSTGSGKSVGASVIVEEALDKKIPVVVFDPTAQWTGFVKQCEDENLLKYYKQFGMDERYTKPYKGMILEVTDPHIFIDFKKYMNPGEITVFTMNKLGPGEYDVAVKNIINAIFKTGWEESIKLKMIIVFDEVHRLLEKYGGIGGYTSLEQACREFRKWGIGVIMCSQVLADFKEAIAGNVLTDVQMNTKSLIDIRKVETKYGLEYATRISRQGVGVGMLQNPKYNEGKPYFVQFRPTWHNPHKITDEELGFYREFAQRLDIIEKKIEEMKTQKRDVSDIEIELKLAKDKLKQGRFRMAKIYVNSLEEHLNIRQEIVK